ncbi:MAG: hypothetical protein AB7G25_08760 [Sphingomonadaceae bacterium]
MTHGNASNSAGGSHHALADSGAGYGLRPRQDGDRTPTRRVYDRDGR